jgi:hypothetical protein
MILVSSSECVTVFAVIDNYRPCRLAIRKIGFCCNHDIVSVCKYRSLQTIYRRFILLPRRVFDMYVYSTVFYHHFYHHRDPIEVRLLQILQRNYNRFLVFITISEILFCCQDCRHILNDIIAKIRPALNFIMQELAWPVVSMVLQLLLSTKIIL